MPTSLTGKQDQALCDVIVALFESYGALDQFAWNQLNTRLSAFVTDAGQGMTLIAGKLTLWAQNYGTLPLLIVQLWVKNPNETRLQELATDLAIPLIKPASSEQPPLAGMAAAAENTAARTAMQAYKPDIVNLCIVTTKLGALKFLHDRLDTLRLTICKPLDSVKARLPAPDAQDSLDDYRRSLDKLVLEITGRVTSAGLTENDVAWVEECLLPAQSLLTTAANSWPAETELDSAMGLLADITTRSLAEVNGQIKAGADAMNIPIFSARMDEMKSDVAPLQPTDAERQGLADDLDRIKAAITALAALVIEHDLWQRIKDAAGALSTARRQPVKMIRLQWVRPQRMIEKSRVGAIFPPADALFAAVSALDATLTAAGLDDSQPSDAARDAISGLENHIDNHFYTLDANLLGACENIGQLGSRLGEVLEALNG